MRIYSAKILDKLVEVAQQKNILCIADEVFTGFGRTGKLFASDHIQHKPDIIALSKGLTGGAMALGVTSCSQKIASAFETNDFLKTFFHGHSYTANPLACAAANASFKLLMDDTCAKNISRIALQHEHFMIRIQEHVAIHEVRALGTILAIELRDTQKTTYENELRKKIYPYFLERGILLRPLGNIIYILPPYIITNDELMIVYSAIEEFINTLKTSGPLPG
jgi:adenosylmethionine-8-amino-7-oxononanoate aminotransferase